MRTYHCLTVAATLVAAIALAGPASAQATKNKKMTYEQAYTACKKELDTSGTTQRYTMGAGCMQKYGFRLKKKAKT
jgi:hypothetical protein